MGLKRAWKQSERLCLSLFLQVALQFPSLLYEVLTKLAGQGGWEPKMQVIIEEYQHCAPLPIVDRSGRARHNRFETRGLQANQLEAFLNFIHFFLQKIKLKIPTGAKTPPAQG